MPVEITGQQGGTVKVASATQPHNRQRNGVNSFPMSYQFANTFRFGHIAPFYFQHSPGGDEIPLYSKHDLNAPTLGSPLKSPVSMSKTYFAVDMKAIYPNTWNLQYVSPAKGSDVPSNARFVVSNFLTLHKNLLTKIQDYLSDKTAETFTLADFNQTIQYIFVLESIFSKGSLLSEFNIHLNQFLRFNYGGAAKGIDDLIDSLGSLIGTVGPISSLADLYVTYDGIYYSISMANYVEGNIYTIDNVKYIVVSRRRFFELLRNGAVFSKYNSTIITQFLTFVQSLKFIDFVDFPINLEILPAYQLGVAQFFSDSRIDDVFNAETYLSTFNQLLAFLSNSARFTYNGRTIYYDYFSSAVYTALFSYALPSEVVSLNVGSFNHWLNYHKNVFYHRRSLKFGDYFVSSRPSPIGVGNVQINTSSGSVSVIDITKNIQYQRFLNLISQSYHTVKDYARTVLGLDDAGEVSYEIPEFISSREYPIRGMEIENTGDGQRDRNSITTLLKTVENTQAFVYRPKRPCIVIGVYTFDVRRLYTKSIDRMHMHEDRYDDFIPQLQYTGDQAIYLKELNPALITDSNQPFAYTMRYMEYKIRNSYSAGDAIGTLKTWFMNNDDAFGGDYGINISSDYIRSNPSDFDRFFTANTGFSLASNYHFIINTENFQTLQRQMDYSPQPLK